MSDDALAPSPGITLTDDQRLSWLQLVRSENVGPVSFRELINHFGTAGAALDAIPDLAARAGRGKPIRLASRADAERELERLHAINGFTVCLGEPDYPPALRACDGAPPVLSVAGSRDMLKRDCVAFVGSRNSSVTGEKFTAKLAADIAGAGYGTVSGLARGIDAAAHRASLAGGTIAVFAGGLDVIYPNENKQLAHEIADNGGALVSEMPLGWKPRAQDFPRRNRIVAGIALGLVVVEAAKRSGSLISARLANEMGRQVFAVPGSPLDPRSEGANHLIRSGATLITGAEDIVSELAPLVDSSKQARFEFADQPQTATSMEEPSQTDRQRLIAAIGQTPTEIDDLIAHTNIPAGAMQMLLLELDLAGLLERQSGNRVSIIPA